MINLAGHAFRTWDLIRQIYCVGLKRSSHRGNSTFRISRTFNFSIPMQASITHWGPYLHRCYPARSASHPLRESMRKTPSYLIDDWDLNLRSYLALPACQHAQATLWRSRRDRMDAVAAVTAHLPANQLPCTWINPGCRAEVLQSKDLESNLRGGSSRERNSSGVGRMSQLGRRSCLAQFCWLQISGFISFSSTILLYIWYSPSKKAPSHSTVSYDEGGSCCEVFSSSMRSSDSSEWRNAEWWSGGCRVYY